MFNRVEYGLHHPGNIAPVCKYCNRRKKNRNGKYLSWKKHLEEICRMNDEIEQFETRCNGILNHIGKGKFAYPKLTENEKNSIRVIAESLYHNIVTEIESSLLLYQNITTAFVNRKHKD